MSNLIPPSLLDYQPAYFDFSLQGTVATLSLKGAERKNPLTFDSYAELRDLFRALPYHNSVEAVVIASSGGNFCSGGDVHDIIGPLVQMDMKQLLGFTRMTGDLVKAVLSCNKPVIAAVEGVCVGAGAILAMAADLRFSGPDSRTAFLFTRVGLAGCDMGACAILPRIIGQGRAAELLYSGRSFSAREGQEWGFYNAVVEEGRVNEHAQTVAQNLTEGPCFAHGITKTQLNQEWSMSLEQAIECEAQAQAICMQTKDFKRAYQAFVNKEKPVFGGD